MLHRARADGRGADAPGAPRLLVLDDPLVHADPAGLARHELSLLARLGVVKAKRHGKIGEGWAPAVSPRDRARALIGRRFLGSGPRSQAPGRV